MAYPACDELPPPFGWRALAVAGDREDLEVHSGARPTSHGP
jgi:hypothetical protein